MFTGFYVYVGAISAWFLWWPVYACAAEWSLEPSVSAGREYNNNVRFTTISPKNVSATIFAPKLEMGARSELWEVSGDAKLRSRRYSGNSDLDRDDTQFDLFMRYGGERSAWQLGGSHAKESLLVGQDLNSDTGLVGVQVQRTTRKYTPSWIWRMTETKQIKLEYQYIDAIYEKGFSVNLFDYMQKTASLAFVDQMNEIDQISLSLSYTDFGAPSARYDSTSTAVQVGVVHNFSQTLKGSVSVGQRNTKTDVVSTQCTSAVLTIFGIACLNYSNVTSSSDVSGSVYSLGIEKQFEAGQISASLSRALNPSGSGSQVETDSLSIIASRDTTKRLKFRFTLDGARNRSIGGNASLIDRDYYRIAPAMQWRWTENLFFDAIYSRKQQKYLNLSDAATANILHLTLSYHFPRMSISR